MGSLAFVVGFSPLLEGPPINITDGIQQSGVNIKPLRILRTLKLPRQTKTRRLLEAHVHAVAEGRLPALRAVPVPAVILSEKQAAVLGAVFAKVAPRKSFKGSPPELSGTSSRCPATLLSVKTRVPFLGYGRNHQKYKESGYHSTTMCFL